MKIDRNLIDHDLSQEKIATFKKYLFDNIHLKKPIGFKRFITSIFAYIFEILLFLIGIWIMWIGSSYWNHIIIFINDYIFLKGYIVFIIGIVFLLVSVLGFLFSKNTRSKLLDNSIADLNFLDISRKWFSNYDLKDEDVNNFENKEMRILIEDYKRSPQEASIHSITSPISIKVKNITTTFFSVTWVWEEEDTDKDGKTITTFSYLDQIYMLDYGFSEKWDNFEFSFYQEKASFFKKRKQSLENINFDKWFKYTHNNPIKLRMLFTPSIQENFLNKFKWNSISINKIDDLVITTCENGKISPGFSPFTLKLGTSRLNKDIIKNNVANNLIANFKLLMTFMGHTRIMYPIYEK